ncbi:MAG: PD40 domain-containing protein [Acidobacteria bacterium]|nr:PD40 domain-containing protein [Acidobacteriota bacterium]
MFSIAAVPGWFFVLAGVLSAAGAPSFAEPSVCPVTGEIVFASGGDLWSVPPPGGIARLLVSHPAAESRPLCSPDGTRLAFVSQRTGEGDIYVLTLAGGELRRITYSDSADNLDGWSRDGKWLYFHSTAGDISGSDIFRVSSEGGTPLEVSAERYYNEFFSAPSPDGAALAITARGMGSLQWWRNGRSHIDESEIWLRREGSPPVFEKLAEKGAKNLWPMWSPDGKSLYYMSDRSGAENLWVWQGGKSRPLTRYTQGRLLWPSVSYDGRWIVFERDFRLHRLDTRSGAAVEIAVALRGAPASPGAARLRLSEFSGLALSPDGKKIAFTAHGEIFAAGAKDGGDAVRLTRTSGPESALHWAPDSKRLVYVSDRDGVARLWLFDFPSRTEKQLTSSEQNDAAPRFSPDGKSVAFVRHRRELRVVEIASGAERVLARAPLGNPSLAWSGDGKWIAFLPAGQQGFHNPHVAAAAGGEEPRALSFLANVFSDQPLWSPDGTFLLFTTSQRTEDSRVARIDLTPRTPKLREDQFRDLFQETPKETAAKKTETTPVEIVFPGVKERLRYLDLGLDAQAADLSPDGKTLLVTSGVAGQSNLYTYSLDELAKEPPVARQLTSTAARKSGAQFSPDGKEVFYLEGGRIMTIGVENRQARPVAVTAEMEVDFDSEKGEVFRQAWTYLRDNFYDPAMHGADWNGVRAAFAPQIEGARTPDEMRRLISQMLGELNASHLGISAPSSGARPAAVGRLGLRFDRAEYEAAGRLRISEVIPLGPADVAKIKPGEYLLAVDGVAAGAGVNLDRLLEAKAGRRVALEIASAADGSGRREVVVRPVDTSAERNLLYREWVSQRRQHVARASGGRLGYVHIRDMGTGSLNQLYADLDTENRAKEGVVVDIRNNNGGFVNAYALDVFARRPYMTMTPREMPSSPARSMLGQRALELPTILVTNQMSLSDAEDFTEGYRTLKLGKVVGEPTAGWIIYTGGTQLIDGSLLRSPFIRITGADGKPMERNPRPVDLRIDRPMGETAAGRDSQLDAAVKELLAQLGGPAAKP